VLGSRDRARPSSRELADVFGATVASHAEAVAGAAGAWVEG
jgi:hypothetical protein